MKRFNFQHVLSPRSKHAIDIEGSSLDAVTVLFRAKCDVDIVIALPSPQLGKMAFS